MEFFLKTLLIEQGILIKAHLMSFFSRPYKFFSARNIVPQTVGTTVPGHVSVNYDLK